jgi:dipeptidase E
MAATETPIIAQRFQPLRFFFCASSSRTRTSSSSGCWERAAFSSLPVPFQINPHYVVLDATLLQESRGKRIGEFLHENDVPVVGLREGAWLDVRDTSVVLGGPTGGRLVQRATEPRDLLSGADLSGLLKTRPQYDCPIDESRSRPRDAEQH